MPFDQFKIDGSATKIKLNKILDYDNNTEFRFNLTVQGLDDSYKVISNDTTLIVINVIDRDNKPPAFTQNKYTVKIPENAKLNSVWNITTGIPAYDQDKGIKEDILFSVITEFSRVGIWNIFN